MPLGRGIYIYRQKLSAGIAKGVCVCMVVQPQGHIYTYIGGVVPVGQSAPVFQLLGLRVLRQRNRRTDTETYLLTQSP